MNKELQKNIDVVKSALNSKASTSHIMAFLQECPCLFKCIHEIQNHTYNNVDSLYSAKHEYAKTKMIDAIRDKFSDLITISSEYRSLNGKLDIVLLLRNEMVAIELKGGKYTDASLLFQIERYLLDCNVLIFVKIPSEEVSIIRRKPIEPNLIRTISLLNRKTLSITRGQRDIIQGDWCNGCNAECSFRKPSRWSYISRPTLADFGDFMKNIDIVIGKVLQLLTKELK